MAILDKLLPHTDSEQINVGEAYTIWTQVTARYDALDVAQQMVNFIHDKDLKAMVSMGISTIIEPQIKKMEALAGKNKIPLPNRPPKPVDMSGRTDEYRDEGIFRTILDSSQTALHVHVKAIGICNNDVLRNMYEDFLKQELDNYDIMVKYGKAKGWVFSPPIYSPTN